MVPLTHLAHAPRTLLTVTADNTAHATRFARRRSKLTEALFAQAPVAGSARGS